MNKNIVLTGFMGTGKSLVSKELARRLNRKVVSTDALIEEKEGRTIADIFLNSGEDYFREVETEVVNEIALKEGMIVDCGGGVALNPENISKLTEKGIIFCFTASPEVIYQRVKDTRHRPLLNTEDPKERIIKLLEERKSFYEKAGRMIDTSDHTVGQTAEEVLRLLPHE